MDENQKRAADEGKLTPVRVRLDLSRCVLNAAALTGEERDGRHPAEGA
jgi:hypothetical protein